LNNSVVITSEYNHYAITRIDVTRSGAKQIWKQPYASGLLPTGHSQWSRLLVLAWRVLLGLQNGQTGLARRSRLRRHGVLHRHIGWPTDHLGTPGRPGTRGNRRPFPPGNSRNSPADVAFSTMTSGLTSFSPADDFIAKTATGT